MKKRSTTNFLKKTRTNTQRTLYIRKTMKCIKKKTWIR